MLFSILDGSLNWLYAVLMKYQRRACELCGSNELDEAFSWSADTKTKVGQTSWRIRNVVCARCGFAFVSPAPAQEDLISHYAAAYAVFDATVLGVADRLAFIKQHCIPGDVVEIGGNNSTEFSAALSARSYLNSDVVGSSDVTSVAYVGDGSADLVLSYYVFEHLVDVPAMLRECRRILRNDGVLIIEVPDLDLYDKRVEAIAFAEHVNHFSRRTLQAICARMGFQLIDTSKGSRSFGFVAAFRTSQPDEMLPPPDEADRARRLLLAGKRLMETEAKGIVNLRQSISKWSKDGSVVLWGANGVTEVIIGGVELDVWLVDATPAKRGFVTGHIAHLPGDSVEQIRRASRLVIFADSYAEPISQQFRAINSAAQIVVYDQASESGFKPL